MNPKKIEALENALGQVLDEAEASYAEIAEAWVMLAGGMLTDPDLDAPQVEALVAYLRGGLDAAVATRGETPCVH